MLLISVVFYYKNCLKSIIISRYLICCQFSWRDLSLPSAIAEVDHFMEMLEFSFGIRKAESSWIISFDPFYHLDHDFVHYFWSKLRLRCMNVHVSVYAYSSRNFRDGDSWRSEPSVAWSWLWLLTISWIVFVYLYPCYWSSLAALFSTFISI